MNGHWREAEFTLPIGYESAAGTMRRRGALRKMTGREEAILADKSNQGNGGKLVTELIHSCVTQFEGEAMLTKPDVANWYSADRNYVLIRLRAFTFGPEMPATYTCPSCGDKLEVMENLDELPVKTLAENEELSDVQIELQDGYWDKDTCQTAMSLTLPRGIDETVVAPLIRKNASTGKNALLARCLTRLGDMPKHRMEQLGSRIFNELTLTDRRLIDRALNQGAPGIDLTRDCTCPSCGSDIRANLDMTHFLSPD
jgi:rubredoxin